MASTRIISTSLLRSFPPQTPSPHPCILPPPFPQQNLASPPPVPSPFRPHRPPSNPPRPPSYDLSPRRPLLQHPRVLPPSLTPFCSSPPPAPYHNIFPCSHALPQPPRPTTIPAPRALPQLAPYLSLQTSALIPRPPMPALPHQPPPYTSTDHNDDKCALFTIPTPAIREELRSGVQFVVDDNDKCVYSFTPVNDRGIRSYEVSVYDVREGNNEWKKLPSLPNLEQYYALRSSSFDNGGYYTTYQIVWVPGADEIQDHDLIMWTFIARHDVTESQSVWEPEVHPSPDLIEKLTGFEAEHEPPIYLEFNMQSDSGVPLKRCAYELCDHGEFDLDYSNALELNEV